MTPAPVVSAKPLHHTVIIGAGFAGLRTAIELEKRYPRIGNGRITLIDREVQHVYTPLLYEVCSGALEDQSSDCEGELRAGVCIRYDQYVSLLRRKHIQFLRGDVVGLDQNKKDVLLADGSRISFDDVVIAIGSEPNTYGIPGVAEHACFMKTLDDAMRIRERIAAFLAAYKEGKESRLSIVVGGAGATGVELAAELANFFNRLVREGVLKTGESDVLLVEAGPDVLMMCGEPARQSARKRLGSLGVRVLLNTKINSVQSGSVMVTDEKEETQTQEADVVVWTGGIKAPRLVETLGLPRSDKGYVSIEPSFLVRGCSNIYVVGDAADVRLPKTGALVPKLGQAAERQAVVVAENIVRVLERKTPVSWAPPERWLTVIPLGGRFAVVDFGRFALQGFPAFLLRKVADLFYFSTILPVPGAWKLWRQGSRVYRENN